MSSAATRSTASMTRFFSLSLKRLATTTAAREGRGRDESKMRVLCDILEAHHDGLGALVLGDGLADRLGCDVHVQIKRVEQEPESGEAQHTVCATVTHRSSREKMSRPSVDEAAQARPVGENCTALVRICAWLRWSKRPSVLPNLTTHTSQHTRAHWGLTHKPRAWCGASSCPPVVHISTHHSSITMHAHLGNARQCGVDTLVNLAGRVVLNEIDGTGLHTA